MNQYQRTAVALVRAYAHTIGYTLSQRSDEQIIRWIDRVIEDEHNNPGHGIAFLRLHIRALGVLE